MIVKHTLLQYNVCSPLTGVWCKFLSSISFISCKRASILNVCGGAWVLGSLRYSSANCKHIHTQTIKYNAQQSKVFPSRVQEKGNSYSIHYLMFMSFKECSLMLKQSRRSCQQSNISLKYDCCILYVRDRLFNSHTVWLCNNLSIRILYLTYHTNRCIKIIHILL